MSQLGAAMVRRGWSRGTASDSTRFVGADDLSPTITRSRPVSDVHVLHLVGDVVETNAGLRFDPVGGDGNAGRSSSTGGPRRKQVKYQMESVGPPDAPLLSAADVDRRYGGPVLCILQAQPVPRVAERRNTDRIQAGLARSFAAELHGLGVPMVLVLPPLEPQLAAELVGRIDRLLKNPSRATSRLDRCVLDLQRRVLRAGGPEPGAWERAFDLCLYLDFDDAARDRP